MPFLPSIGPGELILILIIALVVLGPGKLPDVAASLGKSIREFRKAATDVTEAAKLDAPAPSQASQISAASPATPAAAAEAGADTKPTSTTGRTQPADAAPNAGEPARDPNLS